MAVNVLVLSVLATALSFANGAEVIGTHYTNQVVVEIGPKDQQVFIASTCAHFNGFDVNVGIQLFHNPDWIISKGVVRFYVTDVAPTKGYVDAGAVLCTNSKDSETPPSPNCTVTGWNGGSSALYVVATNGDVGGIAYSILVEFGKPMPAIYEEPTKKSNKTYIHPEMRHLLVANPPIYLVQSVRSTQDVSIPMGGDVVLGIIFCPDKTTSQHYEITSSIISSSVYGSFNQYICKSSTPEAQCHPDNPGVLGSNPNQMPINLASVVTTVGDLEELWVRIYCWNGDMTTNGTFVGSFVYGASLASIAP